MMEHAMIRSGHVDTFARVNLPPQTQWPQFRFTLPELQYPERLNCVTEFVDKWGAAGAGDRPAIISPAETLNYPRLAAPRPGALLRRHQGEDHARAVQRPPGRRDGEDQAARAPSRSHRLLGQRRSR